MKDKNPKEAKRDLIIEAAIQVFSENGYHNATMGEIAAVAGIGKGTIYEYFDSKIQLFQQMLASGWHIYYQSLNTLDMQQKSVEERIRLLVAGHISFCRHNSELTRLVFWEAEVQDSEVKDWMYQMRKEKETRLQELFAEGIARGELRDQDPYIMTLMVSGVIGSMWAPLVLEGWDVDTSYLADRITNTIMYGIKNNV
jgi:AcrR family transcriptional regulator